MTDVFDAALEHYRRQHFLQRANLAYAALAEEPVALKGYHDEMKSLDGPSSPAGVRSWLSSVNTFNQGRADLVVMLHITSTLPPIPFHILIQPPEGGLSNPSNVLCEVVRSISKDRLVQRWGVVAAPAMNQVEDLSVSLSVWSSRVA
jgi:mRNA interferase MazF